MRFSQSIMLTRGAPIVAEAHHDEIVRWNDMQDKPSRLGQSQVIHTNKARSLEAVEPLAQLDKDAVRIQIDDAISKVLSLPSLTPVRELLAREPGLSAVEINPRHGELEEAEAEPEQAVLL
jgi:hypothetical protein